MTKETTIIPAKERHPSEGWDLHQPTHHYALSEQTPAKKS